MFSIAGGMTGAIDIGGTKIAAGLVSGSGQIVKRTEWPTEKMRDPEPAVAAIAGWFASQPVIDGIGIACTGPVDPLTGIVGDVDFLPGWDGFNLVRAISQSSGRGAHMENDADAAALAEYRWGAGQGNPRFLYITVSTGIGSGFVIDGRLYRGANGAHPEAGHFSVDPSGPICYCGTPGCWEAMASGPAMAGATGFTARDICARARDGDRAALEIVQNEAKWLAIGIATLVSLYGPGKIALGGGVMQSHDLLLAAVQEGVRSRCKLVPFDVANIVPAALGNDAALIGAALVWKGESGWEKNADAA